MEGGRNGGGKEGIKLEFLGDGWMDKCGVG